MNNLTLLAPLLLLVPLAPAPTQDTDAVETAEDVEILRRLLVHELEGGDRAALNLTLRPRLTDSLLTVDTVFPTRSTPAANTVTHSNGFHLPGTGAFFCVEMQVPTTMVAHDAPDDPDEPRDKDDDASTTSLSSSISIC